MRNRKILCFLSVLGAMTLAIGTFAQTSRLQIIASHSILADVAQNVVADRADLSTLIPTGADPHSFIPSPGDLTTVAEADLVLINGAGYEESLLDAIMNAGEEANIVNASACVEIRPFGAGMHHEDEHADDDDMDHADEHDDDDGDEHEDDHADEHDEDDDEHDDDHADDDDDDHADEHDDDEHGDDDHDDAMSGSLCDAHDAEFAKLVGEEDGHAHFTTLGRAEDIDCGIHDGLEDDGHAHGESGCDPHLWMDPHNVIYWVLMIRDVLSEADPANAEHYSSAAQDYAQELVALEADFILPLLEELPVESRVLVTSHESLGYFATTFDFEIVTTYVPGMATSIEPSARDVAALIDRIRSEGVPAIFGDTAAPLHMMTAVANEAGVKLFGLYSDTLTDGDGPAATYLDYMRYNVTTIVDALKGE